MTSIEFDTTSLVMFISLLAMIAFAFVIKFLPDFISEMKYINLEISRTDGREQKHWIRERRKMIKPILITVGIIFVLLISAFLIMLYLK